MTPELRKVFDEFESDVKAGVLGLRALIFEEASNLPQIGKLEEVLRWGQPSYITPEKRAATTLRLGAPKTGGFAIYAHCQSNVISDFVTLFPSMDKIDGNRAVLFDNVDQIDPKRHGILIRSALTYHL